MDFNPGSRPGATGSPRWPRLTDARFESLPLGDLLHSRPGCTAVTSPGSRLTLPPHLANLSMSRGELSIWTLTKGRSGLWELCGDQSAVPGVDAMVVVIRFTSRLEQLNDTLLTRLLDS